MQCPECVPRTSAKMERIEASKHHICVDCRRQFIEVYAAPQGYSDEVKDKLKAKGTNLSGGQQQRLCIARALAQAGACPPSR